MFSETDIPTVDEQLLLPVEIQQPLPVEEQLSIPGLSPEAEMAVEAREVSAPQAAFNGLKAVLAKAKEAVDHGTGRTSAFFDTLGDSAQRTFRRLVDRSRARGKERIENRVERLEHEEEFQKYLGDLATQKMTGGGPEPVRVEPVSSKEKSAEIKLEHKLFKQNLESDNERRANAIFGNRRGKISRRGTKQARGQLIAAARQAFDSGAITGSEAMQQIRTATGVVQYAENRTQSKHRKKSDKASDKVIGHVSQPVRSSIRQRRLVNARRKLGSAPPQAEDVTPDAGPTAEPTTAVTPEATERHEPVVIPTIVHPKGELFGGPDKKKFFQPEPEKQLRGRRDRRPRSFEDFEDEDDRERLDRPDLRVVTDREPETEFSLEGIDRVYHDLLDIDNLADLDYAVAEEIRDRAHAVKDSMGLTGVDLPDEIWEPLRDGTRDELRENYVYRKLGIDFDSLPPVVQRKLIQGMRIAFENRTAGR